MIRNLKCYVNHKKEGNRQYIGYTKAAEAGDKAASIRLGGIYSHYEPTVTDKRFPLSIDTDLNKAYRYYKKAEYHKGMKRVQQQKR